MPLISAPKNGPPVWITQPQKKHLAVFTSLYVIGLMLSVMAATNLFTENPFQKNYLIMGILLVLAGYRTAGLWLTYFRNQNSNPA